MFRVGIAENVYSLDKVGGEESGVVAADLVTRIVVRAWRGNPAARGVEG